MIRQIIEINEAKCDGCGLCADACHEGAIGIIDGKAKLLRDDYCDGLGNCLPICPTGAISFIEREAAAFDETAVNQGKERVEHTFVCPGTESRSITHTENTSAMQAPHVTSELRQWPIQIQLVPAIAPFFDEANLLIAADCTAYARAGFHAEFMRGKVTLIGCPKLDDVDYTEKLTEIMRGNTIKSLTIIRMEVPCCGGIEQAATAALKASGKFIPWQVITIGTDGEIRE